MSTSLKHIENILKECHKIQEQGHCERNPPAWVIVNDIEIKVHELRKLFEDKSKE